MARHYLMHTAHTISQTQCVLYALQGVFLCTDYHMKTQCSQDIQLTEIQHSSFR